MKLGSYLLVILLLVGILSAQQQPQQQPSPQQTQSKEPKPPDTTAATNNKRRRVITNLAGFDLLEAKKLSGETIVVGATRGMPHLVALAPRLGKLFGTNPTFSWSHEGPTEKFVIVLSDDSQAEIFRADVDGAQFRYPTRAPALQPGKIYFWSVAPTGSFAGFNSSDPSGLSVVSTEQQQEIERKLAQYPGASYEAGLARAGVFTDYRLWYDALTALTDLIEQYPDRAELYELRGTIYAQLDCTRGLAEADFSRAEEAKIKMK